MEIEENSDSEDPFAELNRTSGEVTVKYLTSYKITSLNLLKKHNSIKGCFNV
jgi:hypothetical protein